jgi:hypothetical protein
VKKKYYGKSEYAYTVYSLNIPKEFHEFLPPFLDRDLSVEVKRVPCALVITLGLRDAKLAGENQKIESCGSF